MTESRRDHSEARSRHTPGPWFIRTIPRSPTKRHTQHLLRGPDNQRLGVVINGEGAETHANARLIAAAPTMLDALKAIAANPRADAEDRNAALAAIAKAEPHDQ